MEFEIQGNPDYGDLTVVLTPGESVLVESGSMSRMSGHMDVRTRCLGGILKAVIRKLFGGQSFFMGEYSASQGGMVGISPNYPGTVLHRDLRGGEIFLTAGSFLACTTGIEVDAIFGGIKALFSGEGAFGSALIHLERGDEFRSDSGAMFRASPNVDIDVTSTTKGGGGVLQGMKRILSGESFFYSTYRTNDGKPGEVGLAPVHQGEVKVIEVADDNPWICTGGSYLGASGGLDTKGRFQGRKGFFTGEALFFLEVSGSGQLLLRFSGRGKLWVQNRSPRALASWVYPFRPEKPDHS